MTVRVVLGLAILNPVHLRAAGCIQEVVTPNVINRDRQHRIASVGPQHVSRRYVDLPAVVEGSAVGQSLAAVMREGHEIAGLAAFDVDDTHSLSMFQTDGRTAGGGNSLLFSHL